MCATPRKPGINRLYWDFRYQPLPAPAGGGQGGGGGGGGGFGGGGGNNGPFVMPGEDPASRWSSNGKDIATKPVRVVGDSGDQSGRMPIARRGTTPALAFHRLQEQANEAADAVTQLGTQYPNARDAAQESGRTCRLDVKTAIEAAGKELAEPADATRLAATGGADDERGRWRKAAVVVAVASAVGGGRT